MNECHFGDCRDVLRRMIADGVKVNMVATSPPYWGLRDYGTATWEGGDDPGCDHLVEASADRKRRDIGRVNTGTFNGSALDSELATPQFRDRCGKCGARRIDSQLGLEPTLAAYVANMVEVFNLVREVLTEDGTCWINWGDSYTSGDRSTYRSGASENKGQDIQNDMPRPATPPGLKPKDLCGVPWRCAFALQEAGWWLRQDLIWSKGSPMPESVQDRCCKSHEYVFLMTKSARYFFDSEAIKEPIAASTAGDSRLNREGYDVGRPERGFPGSASRGSGLLIPKSDPSTRLKRSVWQINSQPYPESHFAVFPEKLVEPMILAGTSAHGHCPCPGCGKGWVRVVERSTEFQGGSGAAGRTAEEVNAKGKWAGMQYGTNLKLGPVVSSTTLGWEPSCAHNLAPVPGVVLDPFLGSGTTSKVAQSLGRNWIGIELNPAYEQFQKDRITQYGFALS